jgi:hypothetical protein
MPMMSEILTTIPTATIEQKTLRSKAITSIGFFIQAVSDEKATFNNSVNEIATFLTAMLK